MHSKCISNYSVYRVRASQSHVHKIIAFTARVLWTLNLPLERCATHAELLLYLKAGQKPEKLSQALEESARHPIKRWVPLRNAPF